MRNTTTCTRIGVDHCDQKNEVQVGKRIFGIVWVSSGHTTDKFLAKEMLNDLEVTVTHLRDELLSLCLEGYSAVDSHYTMSLLA